MSSQGGPTLTFYGGVGEIGGNIIEIRDGSCSIFLDFGKNFERERRYFDEPYLSPREIKHLLALGLLPDLPGLYKGQSQDHEVSAILLSHPHMDHVDYARYVKDEIPILSSQVTRDAVLAREYSSTQSRVEYRMGRVTKPKGTVELVKQPVKTFRVLDPCARSAVGGLEVEAWPVDHSAPGACGFIVHTSAGAVVYTGDFRMHGTRPEETERFLARGREVNPAALVVEGTNIASGRLASEKEVAERIEAIVRRTGGLVLAGVSSIDTTRLATLYTAARGAGRKLVISMKQAFLLLELGQEAPFLPVDDNVRVFRREKSTEYEWEKHVQLSGAQVLTAYDVASAQGELLMICSFYDMNETVEIRPSAGSIYVLSQSEPFNEEMEIDFDKLLNWLERWGVPLYMVHASGHALPLDLKEAISTVGAKQVFLIHTDRPRLYERFLGDITGCTFTCPEVGQAYPLS